MKVSIALAMALLGVASVSAFTVGGSRQHIAFLSQIRGGADPTPGASSTTLHMAAPADFIKSEIASNDVVVWSKSFCPYCTKTKALFQTLGVNAKIYELDGRNDGADIQASLLEMTGQRTVPSVFIKGKHIGGNDDTQGAAKSGELQKMLGIAKK